MCMRILSFPKSCYVFLIALILTSGVLCPALPAQADVPVSGEDLVFAVDVSGSMVKTDPDFLLFRSVKACMEELSRGDNRAAVVPFSDSLTEKLPMTDLSGQGLEAALSYMDSLAYTSGDTDIGLALETAVRVAEEGQGRDRRIILVTDGMIDLPHEEDESAAEKQSLTQALVAAEEAVKEGILIDTAGVGDPAKIDKGLLGYLAERTGGTFVQTAPNGLSDAMMTMVTAPGRQLVPETEPAMTESGTEARTTETEELPEETETEVLLPEDMAPPVIGSVPGQVTLSGLVPQLASSSLDLHDLFDYSDFETEPDFTAEAFDGSVVTCAVKEGMLRLSGKSDGVTTVKVSAERGGSRTETSFEVKVDGFMDLNQAFLILALAAAGIAAAALFLKGGASLPSFSGAGPGAGRRNTVRMNRGSGRSSEAGGKLRFFVKMDGQKIFGVPTQNTVDLPSPGRAVKLSDLIRDPYLETADLGKVILRTSGNGASLATRSQECVIRDQNGNTVKNLTLREGTRFRILCATDMGTAVIVAMYTCRGQEPERKEEENRTRLLV